MIWGKQYLLTIYLFFASEVGRERERERRKMRAREALFEKTIVQTQIVFCVLVY